MGTTLQNGIYLPAEGERNCYSGLAANWTAIDGVIGGYSSHAANLTIHVTAEDKEAWDGKADASALTAHTGDTTIHVTAEDKAAWNGKQDALSQTQLDAVNSGIDSSKVQQIATNTSDISSLQSGKANDSDVVHKSGNETVGGQKTFSDTATFVSVNVEDIRWKSLANQTVDLNDCYIPRAGAISGYYTTDISSGANISNKAINNTAFTMISLTTRRVSASDYQVRQVFYGSGAKYIRTCSNGTWTAWVNETDKYVTTDTAQTVSGNKTFSSINGVEPSSLSLPSDRSARVDISSYFTNTGTGQSNSYTVPANGYIYLTLSELTNIHCFSRTSGNVTNYAQTFTKPSNSTGVLYVLFPVRKNDVFVATWYTTTTVSVDGAFFIPCQGNV